MCIRDSATTVLAGVTLMSRGDLALIPFLMFLIAATRVYDPIGSMFAKDVYKRQVVDREKNIGIIKAKE